MPNPPILSTHRHPRPLVRKIVAGALFGGILVMLFAIPLQISFFAFLSTPLCVGTAVFTAILLIPVCMYPVLHPEIDVTEDGLMLHPMLWPAQSVPWNKIEGIVPHPLVFNDDAMGRVLHGKRYRRREGIAVVVSREAGLAVPYQLVGNLAGVGNRPAFAISSTTHTDYEALAAVIRSHVAVADEPEPS
jgi:hypothetical protein